MTENLDQAKDIEPHKYNRNLLEALLVSSISKDDSRFPSIEEFILSEIVNGTIEYIGGNSGQKDYQKLRYIDGFEKEIGVYFESEMNAHSQEKLDPTIRDALIKLCQYYYENPIGSDANQQPRTELYNHFAEICPVAAQSTFLLHQDNIIRARQEFISKLSDSEKKDIEGIGKTMRKYIDKDVKFIREKYYW